VGLDDLNAYRAIIQAMPEGHKACGFFCGLKEFASCPPHELFSFSRETVDYFDRLEEFLPPVTRDDARYGARISASTLLHMQTHSYL
jgi:hypothetical protein